MPTPAGQSQAQVQKRGVSHRFVNAISDGGDANLVRPSNWNDIHEISFDAFKYEAAKLEPLAIEPLQWGAFSYAISSSVTKLYQSGWNNRIGSSGRFDMREARDPIPLRGVTLNGLGSGTTGSTATFIDPALPDYTGTNPMTVYFDRLQKITEYQTHYIGMSGGDTTYRFLPGPYGDIIVALSFHDTPWLGLFTMLGPSASLLTIHNEIGDAAGDDTRISQKLYIPVNRNSTAGLKLGTTGGPDSVLAGLAYIICDSSWGKVIDSTSYIFRDDFMGPSLNTSSTWNRNVSTVGNIEIYTDFAWLKVIGNGNWGDNGIFGQATTSRATGKIFECYVSPSANTTNCVVGWHDGAGYSYTDFSHCIDFTNSGGSALFVFENGNSRGAVGSGYTNYATYRIRITLNPGGVSNTAKYEIQGGSEYASLGGTTWTDITPGTTSSSTTPLTWGVSISGTNESFIGDIKVY